ncbi:hypothetical protein G6F42_015086 [Rhizopus arrhizus]|nr:hypothetical protein G6F42_015086 [Rhizopus arrhizus]
MSSCSRLQSTIRFVFTSTQLVTLPPSIVTLPPNTVTVTPDPVILPANTITLPADTVTITQAPLPAITVTAPPATITLPPATVVQYSTRQVTSTIVLPPVTSTVVQFAIRQVTTTATFETPGPTTTETETETRTVTITQATTVTQTVGPTAVLNPVVTYTYTTPTVTYDGGFKFPFPIPNFHGAGTYTLGIGSVITVNVDGSYGFTLGGPPSVSGGGSTTFAFPFTIPNFAGPGSYTLSPGNVVQVNADGSYYFTSGGPPTQGGGNTGGSTEDTMNFSFPFDIPGFIGPGTYTLSPGNVVQVNNDGSYTFVEGSAPTGNGGGATNTGGSFSFPFNIPGFIGPGTYTLSPGNVVSVNGDGSYSFLLGGPPGGATITSQPGFTFPTISLPSLNLGGGFSIGSYSGPGIYTLSPGNVVSVSSNGGFSFILGGNGNSAGSVSLPTVSLPTVTLPGGIVLPDFAGSGTYTVSPGNVLSIGTGGITWLQGGPQSVTATGNIAPTISLPGFTFPSITLPTLNLPTLNLGGGFSIGGFSGPGTYTVSPGNVVSVGANGAYSFLTGGSGNVAGSVSLPGVSLPTITLAGGITLPSYSGPGIYTYSPGNVLSIGVGGGITWLQGGPQTASGGGFTFPTISLPAFTFPSITLPTLNLPTLNLGGGFSIGGFSGPGTYTVSPGNVVSVGANGAYSFLTGGSGNVAGTVSLPGVSLPTLTLAGGITLPNYNGPGVYTYSPGNVVSIGLFGGVTWLQGGPSTAAGGGFTFPTLSLPAFTFPSISLPTLSLPSLNLGGGFTINGYNGPGTYTVSPGNVVSVNANGAYTFISGGAGNTAGTVSLPGVSLPTLTLAGGITLPNYSGPGIYTYSPGNVVSIGLFGGVTWLQGGPSTAAGGGFTFPTFGFPSPTSTSARAGFTFPSITLPTLNLPVISLGNSLKISAYTGAGIYTVAPGVSLSVEANGVYSYFGNSGSSGSTGGSLTLPALVLPTITLAGGIPIPNFSGPGLYTVSPGNVVSVGTSGGITWVQGGPQSLAGGGFTFPGFTFPTATTPAATGSPGSTVIGGVTFKFPFNIPGFYGPGIYILSIGNVVQVNNDGTYTFISGGPPVSSTSASPSVISSQPVVYPVTFPSISLPIVTFPTVNLPGGSAIPGFTGAGVYTVGSNVVSVDANGASQR